MGEMKDVWVVYQNTDLTEGRGHQVPIHVCESQTTAIRLSKKKGVQGTDAEVYKCIAVRDGGAWKAPVQIVPPSKEDILADKAREEVQSVIAKAKALGLTEDELKVLVRASQ